MAKKDFSSINTGRVYRTIAEATAKPEDTVQKNTKQKTADVKEEQNTRKIHTDAEKQSHLSKPETPEHKKTKLPRINMAFTPESYDYIRTMSRVSGITLTEFVNAIIKQHMDKYRQQYEKAIEFRNSL